MAVSKQLKQLEKSNVELTFTVPKDEVKAQYQNMIKEYTKTVQLPGFRKGKVPQEVLERKYGDALKEEALGRVIENTLQDHFKEENLPREERPLPYSMPELQGEPKFDQEQDLQFSVIYDVLPEVKVGQWKGLTVEYPYAEVEEADINKELEEIRERNAIVMDKDDGASAVTGDVVTIDYSIINENDEPIADLARNDFAYTLGSEHNFYEFDDDIVGMKKGETKEVEKKFDDDFFEKSLAGQTVKIKVTLSALKEKKLPDLDDDLAQDVDEKYQTLDDLKNSIKERLTKNLERHLRDKKLEELLKKIMENTPVVLPESMINAEIEGRMRNLARHYGINAEMMMQMMKSGPEHEKMEKEWRETAEKALHSRIIIETLIEEQKYEITDDDAAKEIEEIAAEHNVEVEKVKESYNSEQAMLHLKEDIKEKRLIDLMLSENTLNQGKKENYLDFMTKND